MEISQGSSTYNHNDYASEFKKRASDYWYRAVQYAKGNGSPPERPYQVEIHPVPDGSPVCSLRCVDCHGQFQRRNDATAPYALYVQLIDDLIGMEVPSVCFSGIYSDPTSSPELLCELLNRGGSHWGVKLHTYGIGVNSILQDCIIKAAEDDPNLDSYINITKLTTDPKVYKRMCHPLGDAAELLEIEQSNLKQFFQKVDGLGVPLTVRLNCRVTQLNGTPDRVADLLKWLGEASDQVSIRFTTDYVPSLSPDSYLEKFFYEIYMPPVVVQSVIELALQNSGFDRSRVSFRDVGSSLKYGGNRCFNGLVFAAVSSQGKLYPCEGAASPIFGALSYGDLRDGSFPDLWRKYVEGWLQDKTELDCPRCVAACDWAINSAMEREVET